MYRNEDALVAAMLQESPQLLTDGWTDRLRIDDVTIGTGYTADDVRSFSSRIDVSELDEYCRAVSVRTLSWLAATDEGELNRIPDVDRLLIGQSSILSPSSAWVPDVWRNKTIAQMYAYFIVGHGQLHFGEIEGFRSEIGVVGL
ncbi:MAG: hypothetical protein NVS3B26_26040 [Mycobacteriales bacterium]